MQVTDTIDPSVLTRVLVDFFNNTVISYEQRREGQTCVDQRFVIGAKAGPTIELDNLWHEMGHFAQRPIEKLKLFPVSSWGFTFGKFWQIGNASGYEPYTGQAVLTERDVWAYQLSLHRHYGQEIDPYVLARIATWLDAFTYYRRDLGSELNRIKYLANEIDVMSRNEFAYQRFCDEWNSRIDVLQNL